MAYRMAKFGSTSNASIGYDVHGGLSTNPVISDDQFIKGLKDEEDDDDEEIDTRINIDVPVPAQHLFVNRVEQSVVLQMCGGDNNQGSLTIPSFLNNVCSRYGKRKAFITWVDSKTTPTVVTYEDYYWRSLMIAKGLISVGLKPHDGVGFICHNTLKVFYSIMGSITAGGIYVDLNAPDNRTWIVNTMNETKCSVVFVDSEYAKDVQLEIWDELVNMKSIILIHASDDGGGQDARIHTMKDLVERGKAISDQSLARRIGTLAPNKCCAIFYRSNEILNQSNTRGIMMSHDNLTFMANLMSSKISKGHVKNFPAKKQSAMKVISMIPLTKPLAFVMEVLLPAAMGACVYTTNSRLSTVSLWRILTAVRPTLFWPTLRTWTHLRSKIAEKTRHLTKLKSVLFKYSKQAMMSSLFQGTAVPRLAQMLTKEIVKALGLDQVGQYFCFGQALPQNHYEYFLSINIHVFALREVRYLSGPVGICLNKEDFRSETIGKFFAEFETKKVQLGRTSAHGLYIKGRCVCMGFLHESVVDHVDDDGFINTDMLVCTLLEENYYLRTSADEIVLRTGACLPYHVEGSFKRLVPVIANCMIVGDNMKTAALLITLKTVINPETLHPTDQLTTEVRIWSEQKLGIPFISAGLLSCSKRLHVVINGAVVIINMLLKKSGGWIDAYKILPRDFSIPDNEIDPLTTELNRPLILQRYRDDISNMFARD